MAHVSLSATVTGRDLIRPFRARYGDSRLELIVRLLPSTAYMVAIHLASSIHGGDLPPIAVDDRLAHFVIYFGLAITLMFSAAAFAREQTSPRHYAGAGAIAVTYGAVDELHQRFVPGRTPQLSDLAFDALGAACALVLLYILVEGSRNR
ncbi:MAG TPA: VanZ family protein [Thermoanaerobaculia bacterium]|nr:VanZ family protein [Thermoanaerobaculia bacterium]